MYSQTVELVSNHILFKVQTKCQTKGQLQMELFGAIEFGYEANFDFDCEYQTNINNHFSKTILF